MIDEKKLIEDIEKEIEFAMKCNMPAMVAGMRQIASVIEDQPKIGEWISVDDISKIPKERKVYLVTYVTPTGKKYVRSAECSYSGETPRHIEWSKKLNGTVVAWQPLPEPYRPEKESE